MTFALGFVIGLGTGLVLMLLVDIFLDVDAQGLYDRGYIDGQHNLGHRSVDGWM